jgi:hypothetical protein
MTEPSVVAVFPHARVTSLQNSASDLGCPLAADGSRAGIQLPDMQKFQIVCLCVVWSEWAIWEQSSSVRR